MTGVSSTNSTDHDIYRYWKSTVKGTHQNWGSRQFDPSWSGKLNVTIEIVKIDPIQIKRLNTSIWIIRNQKIRSPSYSQIAKHKVFKSKQLCSFKNGFVFSSKIADILSGYSAFGLMANLQERKGMILRTIRNVKPEDLAALRQINQSVSSNPNKSEDQWKLAWLKFLDYYPEHAADTSFCIVNDQQQPIGYLLCAPDADEFFAGMEAEYALEMEKIEPGSWKQFEESQSFLKKYRKDYPAHLHIDISPEGQGMQAGTRLMHRLFEKLEDLNVPGVCLGVMKSREPAIRFYQKNGFKVLEDGGDALIMGRKMQPDSKQNSF